MKKTRTIDQTAPKKLQTRSKFCGKFTACSMDQMFINHFTRAKENFYLLKNLRKHKTKFPQRYSKAQGLNNHQKKKHRKPIKNTGKIQ